MEKKINNEELQSRREFFKKAAKATLPIIAAIALASVPAIGKAADTTPTGCMGCRGGCMSSCEGSCSNSSCKGTCSAYCRHTGAK